MKKILVILAFALGCTTLGAAEEIVVDAEAVASSINWVIRPVVYEDIPALVDLYKAAAACKGGLSRSVEEISVKYIAEIVEKSKNFGLMLVAEELGTKELLGAVSKYRSEQAALAHTLSNGSTLVHPRVHGRGLGTELWVNFIQAVSQQHDIARIELFVRSSNDAALHLYEKVGFVIEGRLKNRILNAQGELEDDLIMAWMNPSFQSKQVESVIQKVDQDEKE